jgi:hypothetical protein
MLGPLPPQPAGLRQAPAFTLEDFAIDFDRCTVIGPRGKSSNWLELPAMAPYTVVRFNPHHANPAPSALSAPAAKRRAP